MKKINNGQSGLQRCTRILLGLILTVQATISVYGQQSYSVGLPLTNYGNDGIQYLTPAILVPEVQFQPPDIQVKLNGMPLPAWLNFTSKALNADVTGDGINDYEIDLFVVAGQCVPIPAGAGICTAPANCSSIPAFATATRRECYQISVMSFGQASTHSLCIYGPEPLAISGTASTQAKNGETINIPFSINRLDEDYAWTLQEALPSYLSFTDAVGKDAVLQFKAPDIDLAEQTFHMNVKSNLQACNKASFTFKVSSKGDAVFVGGPVDIVFVVDVSGSMGEKAVCACSGKAGCPDPPNRSKLNYLKAEIFSLYAQMQTLARAEDKIGLVSFHTTSKIEKILVPFTDNTLMPIVNGWDDNGYNSTAIGQGLNSAVSLLTNTAHKRFIILMTNGMQNETPYLEWADGSKNTVKVGSTVFNNSLGITVIPIAIFTPTGEYRDLLNALGTATGVSVVKDVCESNLSLLQAYNDAAKSLGSPKLVTFKRDVFSGNVATGTFTVNENLDKMLVNIINVGNQNFNSFKLEKNINNTWTDITSLGTISPIIAQSSIRRLFSVNFPAVLGGNPINSSGQYRYTVNSTIPNVPYEFSVIIDDHGVKHSTYTGREFHQAGEPVNLAASVFFNGLPVTDATVVVSLESPIASFSSKFSKAKISGKYLDVTKTPLSEGKRTVGFGVPYINHYAINNHVIDSLGVDGNKMNLADRKYLVLKQETDFGTVFQAVGNTIPLTHQTNGIYKGQFTGTKNVGLYTMHFLITGNVSGIGSVTRMDAKSLYVNFGKPVLSKSKLYVMWEKPVLISVTPMDGSDNLLGPGQSEQLSIYISKGSASKPIDYLDGRYVFQLFGLTDNDDPDIIIRVNTDVLYNGKLSGLSRKRGFITIQGGYAYPQNTLGTNYDAHFLGELKAGYRFWKKLGAQVHLGYYSFKGKNSISNQRIIGGGLGAFYKFPLTTSQGWSIIAELNGGYYKPKNIDGDFGYNAGLGLNAFINYHLSLVLEGKYYSIYTSPDNLNFISSTIGLKFHF